MDAGALAADPQRDGGRRSLRQSWEGSGVVRLSKAAWLALPGLVLAAAPAWAARASISDPAVVQSMSACSSLADAARLACYDRAMAATRKAGADVVVVDRQAVEARRRQSFGFKVPSFALSGRPVAEPPADRLTVELAGADQDEAGDWVMTTRDGAVWRQVNDERPYHAPHAGSQVAIKPAMFGGYFCAVDRQPAIRCVRDR
jgi:hypothetical protein